MKSKEETLRSPLFARELNFRFSSKLLSEKAKYALVGLICLSKHCLTSLLKDVLVRILNHFSCHIGITDTALSCGGVLNNVVKVCDGVLSKLDNFNFQLSIFNLKKCCATL